MLWLNTSTSVDQRPDSRLAWAHRKNAASVSEAGTGKVTSAHVPSTAVSLLANSAEGLGNPCRNQAVSSEATSILSLPLLFLPPSLGQDVLTQLRRRACCCQQCRIYLFCEYTGNLCSGVNILVFKSATKPFLEKAKVEVYLHHEFPFFSFLKKCSSYYSAHPMQELKIRLAVIWR